MPMLTLHWKEVWGNLDSCVLLVLMSFLAFFAQRDEADRKMRGWGWDICLMALGLLWIVWGITMVKIFFTGNGF